MWYCLVTEEDRRVIKFVFSMLKEKALSAFWSSNTELSTPQLWQNTTLQKINPYLVNWNVEGRNAALWKGENPRPLVVANLAPKPYPETFLDMLLGSIFILNSH